MGANTWQKTMYDSTLASATIGSAHFHQLALKETKFLIEHVPLSIEQRILDVCCGTGRHTALLAEAGLDMTGLDINPGLIKSARHQTKRARFAVADMGQLQKYRRQYDVTLNLFSSFGYFATDAANRRVLRELKSTLKAGGKLVLQVVERDWLMSIYQPITWKSENGQLTVEVRRYDPKTHYNESQSIVLNQKTGQARTYYHRIRLYSKPEMVAMLKAVGFKKVTVFGSAEGEKFQRLKSTHPFYVAQ